MTFKMDLARKSRVCSQHIKQPAPLHFTRESLSPLQRQLRLETNQPGVNKAQNDIKESSSSSISSISWQQPQNETSSPGSLIDSLRSRGLLDALTSVAGSRVVFILTLSLLILWAILGGVYGATETWQIVMQNASSIQCYMSDTLLMRQQAITYANYSQAVGEMRSINAGILRMLKGIGVERRAMLATLAVKGDIEVDAEGSRSMRKDWFDRVCEPVATATGSLFALIVYAAGITTWLGFGHYLGWSPVWQLYINTAVAIELTFTSMFLTNVRRRDAVSLHRTMDTVRVMSCDVERILRNETGDQQPNEPWPIIPLRATKIEQKIDSYALVVGSGVGVLISAIVFIIWLSIGRKMGWNANWWLIIGTYTGLVGFIDGFVLRNVYLRQGQVVGDQLESLTSSDEEILALLSIRTSSSQEHIQETAQKNRKPLSLRISNWISGKCALPSAVILSIITVLVVIGVASGMRWSLTGQLIANSPMMIVEGFLLLVLFQAHNSVNAERKMEFSLAVQRRRKMLGAVVELAKDNK